MGQRAHQMNEAIALNNVKPIRGEAMVSDDPSVRPTWLTRRLHDLGVLEMVTPSTKPPGFYVNWTTITGIVLVVSTIAGLWYFTWQTAELRGIEKGKAEAERQRMENELDAMRKRVFVVEEKQKLEQTK